MKIFLLIIPIIFILFYLNKSRRSLVFVCAVPMIFCFGESIFLPIWGLYVRSPMGPIMFDKHDIGFLILLYVWLYLRLTRPVAKRIPLGLDVLAAVLLLLYYFIQPIAIAIQQGYFYKATIVNNKMYYILPLSIFAWSDILRRFTRKEIWSLLNSISSLTVILSFLYILSGVGFKIYPYEPYKVVTMGGSEIVRDFITFPYWTTLAFPLCLGAFLSGQRPFFNFLRTLILLSAIIMTITRSMFISSMVVFILITIYYLIRKRHPLFGFTGVLIFIMVGYYAVGFFIPQNIAFLRERLEDASFQRVDEPNLRSRINALLWARDVIHSVDPVFGLGGPGVRNENVNYLNLMESLGIILGDSMWFHLLLIMGWGGVLLIGLVILTNMFNALCLAFNRNMAVARAGVVAFGFLTLVTGSSFTGEGFYSVAFAATLPMALVIVERQKAWAIQPATRVKVSLDASFVLDCFFREDKYKLLRLLAFYLLIGYFAYRVGLIIAG